MHYKNGREARNGDPVVCLNTYGPPKTGILYGATAGNNDCNGNLAQTSPNDPIADLKNCLHADDIRAAMDGKGGPIPFPNTSNA
jgi:hypothetical protein